MPQLLRDHTRAFHAVRGDDPVRCVHPSMDIFALARTHADPLVQQAYHSRAAKWLHPCLAQVADAWMRERIAGVRTRFTNGLICR